MVYQDIIDQQKDVSIYQRSFFLWKEQWDTYIDPPITLDWQCVKFETSNANKIPTEKGIYAFFIEPRIGNFPAHGYLVYLGQTGHKSKRDLQKRFRDYLYYKTASQKKTYSPYAKYMGKLSVFLLRRSRSNRDGF